MSQEQESTKSKLETQIDEAWNLALTVHHSIGTLGRLIDALGGGPIESADTCGIEQILELIDEKADQLVDKLEDAQRSAEGGGTA